MPVPAALYKNLIGGMKHKNRSDRDLR